MKTLVTAGRSPHRGCKGWVKGRVQAREASFWGAAMERSLHSRNVGRAHSHARISWQKPGAK
eukprot:8284738-Pyramimonas_sp.AAC.1